MLNLKRLKKIAVTGVVSAGKSAVCLIFQERGAYIVSADQITHQFLSLDTVSGRQVISLLGVEVLSDGHIDRKKVAKIVFKSPVLLQQLEEIIHPLVTAELKRQWEEANKRGGYTLFVAEVPLLFETEMQARMQGWWYDATLVVISDVERCIERFCKSGEQTKEDYFLRMARQLSQKVKEEKAAYTIKNDGSLEELKKQVNLLYQSLTET